jgi:hypothetical protein
MSNFFQWNGSITNGAAYTTSIRGTPLGVISVTVTATLTTDTTYTSSETSLLEFNSIMLQSTLGTGGGTATVISGALSSNGTMTSIIDKDTSAQMTTGLLTSSRIQRFTGFPDYIGFTTTLSAGITAGSSVTIKIQPLNL